MSTIYRVSCAQPKLKGTIILEPSKSISNRVLIIQSLCKDPFTIHNLSKSDDTVVLQKMLSADGEKLYAGHAGSSYRFMTARSVLGNREIVLDASEQLRHRPIGTLVKALQTLGADITYINKEGFPPLRIKPASIGKDVHEVTLHAGMSSQYTSALLMIAPCLPEGLTIHLADDPVSLPYIKMTLAVMEWFGASHVWEGNTIKVKHSEYIAKDFTVEGDWSAASYFYSAVALAEKAEIRIEGVVEKSLQGDAVLKDIYHQFGVETIFIENGMMIKKIANHEKIKEFSYDFSSCPDIAQTVMVTMAGLGIKGKLSGLRTLRIKETDRITAMQTELTKVKTTLEVEEGTDLSCKLFGKARWKDKAKFNTYEDHRMAMCFTPLACIHPIVIRDAEVVSKSYPGFWKDMNTIGVTSERVKMK
ncbi:MAG: 3-phosphoshikimate 1-carboxyvinyltransferase [Saprospiraceae bacterium]|uniref:3-phosphoshikimate 1-carboxyvinyltransferase n=1 Tax=Candidatus Opimibacter skivensis TaxID=2982028 RepID=A0A9D7SXL1_9BACT|nr:3-phosphoshikimate 1-carboxyvinyltransferase [Candidatus Opimibacter skivensis]